MTDCNDSHVVSLLMQLFASNDTAHQYTSSMSKCATDNSSRRYNTSREHQGEMNFDPPQPTWEIGEDIYAFSCPFIIAIGLLGNIVSLRVFTSDQLRKLSAGFYLIALSISDSIVLLSYVLLDWLYRGYPLWPGGKVIYWIHTEGICEVFLFISYTFRFISVYLIVVFTVERYIAVCKPLHRRHICTKTFSKRAVLSVYILGGIVSLYKPLLSGVFLISRPVLNLRPFDSDLDMSDTKSYIANITAAENNRNNNIVYEKICSRNMDYNNSNLVLDFLYGLSITAIPFIIITVFNMLILRRLIFGDVGLQKNRKVVIPKHRLRLELTITLLAISTMFIFLNMPYFVVWVEQYIQSINPGDPEHAHHIRNKLYITKSIFTLNYAINFFVYCLTGTYYRGVIKRMLTCQKSPQGLLLVSASSKNGGTEMVSLRRVSSNTFATCVTSMPSKNGGAETASLRPGSSNTIATYV